MRAAPGTTELKDYGPIDQRLASNYPPHAFLNNTNTKQQQINGTKIPNPGQGGLQRPQIYQNGPIYQHQQQGMAKQIARPNAETQVTLPKENCDETVQQPRAYSLPRPKRDELGGPSNIAVVSPMPSSASASKIVDSTQYSPQKVLSSTPVKNGDEALKGQVPTAMQPFGLTMSPEPSKSRQQTHHYQMPNTTTLAALVLPGKSTNLYAKFFWDGSL